jgi:hypothetical protein
MKQVTGSDVETLKNLKLYAISKKLSEEILLEEFVQSRGAYYSAISEEYVQSKKQLKKKVIFTKLFYALVFGILPVIPVFAYFEFINLVTSSAYDFELIIFSISLLYGIFFLLQFFNFLLMAILETTVIMSGKATIWFKTLPFTDIQLKRILYFTVFRNFDIPIIVIVLSFPIAMLIGTANIFIFLISLGISFINTFLALNLIIIISERLNRVLNINDVSSRKTFLIRLFNIFSYVFLIIGSVYIVQWVSTSIGEYIQLFIDTENPELINIILSTIPYPLSQCYLIALMFTPSFTNLPVWFATSIGMGVLLLLAYASFNGALKAIRHSYDFEHSHKFKAVYIEDLKERIKVKSKSSFMAFIKKDLTAATRDLKIFLSFITPILVSFIFFVYLNLQNINPGEPIEIQVFRVWLASLLVSPIIGSILVFSLLNLESTGQTILESLPIVPREQAKAKLLLMFVILNLAILAPSILFIQSSRFLVFLSGILLSLPFAWIFLIMAFEFRIWFFGKRRNYYIVSDSVIGSSFFKLVVIFILPLSICVWLISMSTLIFAFGQPFEIYFAILIGAFLIGGFVFNIILFDKLFAVREREIDMTKFQSSFRSVEAPTFFTRHIWISIFVIFVLRILINNLIGIVTTFIFSIFPSWTYPFDLFDNLIFILYNLTPFIIYSFFYALLYFIFVPKVLGIPYGKKSVRPYLNDIGCNWLRYIFKYSRSILVGTILMIALIFGFFYFGVNITSIFDPYGNLMMINNLISGFWFEFTFRGLILTYLSTRYKKNAALLLHILVVCVFTFLSPSILFFGITNYIFQFLIYLLFFTSYNLILGYIFLKSKNLLPNMIIIVILTFLFFPSGPNPIFFAYPFYG